MFYKIVKKFESLIDLKPFIITYISVISFSNFVFVLFSQTIRDIIWSFFKDASGVIVLGLVFLFAFAWLIKARPHNIPKKYFVTSFDIYGMEVHMDGLRTEFKNHDVAWSFMKFYKKSYPLYNFALVSQEMKQDKKIIFKYI